MRRIHLLIVLLFIVALAACDTPPGAEPTTAVMPTPEDVTPSPTPTPSPTLAEAADPRGEEAIFIEQPDNASRVTSPVTVAGVADPTFEQNLVVRIVLEDGTELAIEPATIQSDLGERGPYSVELAFDVTQETQGFIQVYDVSARDGGILHLSTVGVLLAPDGPDEILMADPQPERIAILAPAMGDTVSGGVASVEGYALASFEQTLVVEVLDEDGNLVGQEPIMVEAPDLGQPGPYSAEVAYTVSSAGAGRIVVRDPSVAFPGDVHIASVEIQLAP